MNRFKLFVTSTALVAATAATAFAASPGAEQIANKLGLDASSYTTNELVIIDRALSNGDTTTANFYIAGGNRTAPTEAVTAGRAQIAAKLGLDASNYSLAELSIIHGAQRAGNVELANFYISGRNHDVRGGVGESAQGKAQLAASLGVNAADYSLAQLSAMYLDTVN